MPSSNLVALPLSGFILVQPSNLSDIPERSAGIFVLLKSKPDGGQAAVIFVNCTSQNLREACADLAKNPKLVRHEANLIAVKVLPETEGRDHSKAVAEMHIEAQDFKNHHPPLEPF